MGKMRRKKLFLSLEMPSEEDAGNGKCVDVKGRKFSTGKKMFFFLHIK